ncbi:MAG: 2,3-bisphosphoglycerate-independent phosphoglycerate mutase [Candidatus Aenigmatarchaeota archaeon]
MRKKKAVLFVADGLGGRPTDLDGETCLEAAYTPHLDELASKGINGLLHSVKRGVRPGSDTAHLSLFGYDPEEVYSGRGVFEASGAGMEVQKTDVCFRTNFATVADTMEVVDRRAGRITEGQEELEEALQDLGAEEDVEVEFKATTQHRGALILRGDGLSPRVSDTDPHEGGHINIRHVSPYNPSKSPEPLGPEVGKEVKKSEPLEDSDAAKRTAEIVNRVSERAHEILRDHPINEERREDKEKLPANALLLRGASTKPEVEDFGEKYGLEGVGIAAGALYLGVAKEVGLDIRSPEWATGNMGSDFLGKTKLVVDELGDNDFVFVHIKAPDNAAHDHDAEKKVECIEMIDEAVGYLLQNLDWNKTHMVFTGDHSTPVSLGNHSAEPVPILYYGPEVRKDSVEEIGERTSARGDLGHINGREVLSVLFNYNDWMKKFGS